MKAYDLILIIGLVLVKILCDLNYELIVGNIFSYQNYLLNQSNISRYLSWFIFILLLPLMVKNLKRNEVSHKVVSILILISFIPNLTMIKYHSNYDIKYIILIFFYWFLLLLFNIVIHKKKFKNLVGQNEKIIYAITFFFIFAIVYSSWKLTSFRVTFDFYDVYQIRTEARGYNVPFLFGYIVNFADNILPILFVYFAVTKRKLLSFILFIVIFLNFGIAALKQIIFLLLFSLIGLFFVRYIKRAHFYVLGSIFMLLLAIIEFYRFNTYLLSDLYTNRILFIPAKLNYVYFDFFNVNELDYFRQSFFKYFLDSPYEKNIGFIMGYNDIQDHTARANNGLFSDAYMNFGIIGVMTFPVILVIIFKIIDGYTYFIQNESMKFIIIVMMAFVFISIPFSTALFSSGILFMILLLSILPRNKLSNL